MNRLARRYGRAATRVPRMRGDEPISIPAPSVFPVCAGMNRRPTAQPCASSGAPRARGDEPTHPPLPHNLRECSPRLRGRTGLAGGTRAISGRPAARWFRRPPRGLGDRLLARITAVINNLDVADLELAAGQFECLTAHR